MKSLELFTGAGGLALGTHTVGFEHVGLVEWNEDACETLRSNVNENTVPGIDRWRVHHTDIRKFNFGTYKDIDLVAGGVPCQPFSLGGKHQGMDDQRDMFPQFVRAVRELRPRAFIIENVKGLLRRQFATYFNYVHLQLNHPDVTSKKGEEWESHLERLDKHHTKGTDKGLCYNVTWRLLNSADYGVPQRRERVFIVGFRSDTRIGFSFPDATHSKKSLERVQASGEYWKRHNTKPRFDYSHPVDDDGLRPWVTIRDAISDLPTPRANDPDAAHHRLVPGARAYPGHRQRLRPALEDVEGRCPRSARRREHDRAPERHRSVPHDPRGRARPVLPGLLALRRCVERGDAPARQRGAGEASGGHRAQRR